MTSDGLVSLIAVLASLFLATRALQAHHLPFKTKVRMAFAWLALIIAVTLLVRVFGK